MNELSKHSESVTATTLPPPPDGKYEQAVVEYERRVAELGLQRAARDVQGDVKSLADPRGWTQRYPFASVAVTAGLAMLLTPGVRRSQRRRRTEDHEHALTRGELAALLAAERSGTCRAAPSAETPAGLTDEEWRAVQQVRAERVAETAGEGERSAAGKVAAVAREELKTVRDFVKRYAIHTAISTLTGMLAGRFQAQQNDDGDDAAARAHAGNGWSDDE